MPPRHDTTRPKGAQLLRGRRGLLRPRATSPVSSTSELRDSSSARVLRATRGAGWAQDEARATRRRGERLGRPAGDGSGSTSHEATAATRPPPTLAAFRHLGGKFSPSPLRRARRRGPRPATACARRPGARRRTAPRGRRLRGRTHVGRGDGHGTLTATITARASHRLRSCRSSIAAVPVRPMLLRASSLDGAGSLTVHERAARTDAVLFATAVAAALSSATGLASGLASPQRLGCCRRPTGRRRITSDSRRRRDGGARRSARGSHGGDAGSAAARADLVPVTVRSRSDRRQCGGQLRQSRSCGRPSRDLLSAARVFVAVSTPTAAVSFAGWPPTRGEDQDREGRREPRGARCERRRSRRRRWARKQSRSRATTRSC